MSSKFFISLGGIILILAFAILGFTVDLFTAKAGSIFYQTENIIQSICVIIDAWLLNRLIKILVWKNYEEKHGHAAPKLFIDIVKLLIVMGAALLIVVDIYHKPPLSIFTAGSVIAAGLTFSLKELVLDAFASFILDFERPFKIGDWIEISHGVDGKVINSGWRQTKVLTHEDIVIYVPNGHLVKGKLTNLSQPHPYYWRTVEIVMSHRIPIDRVQRIVHGAVSTLPELHEHNCRVYALGANEKGVTYAIRYCVKNHAMWRETQHAVLKTAIEHLHSHGLHLSESMGEYAWIKGGQPWQEINPVSIERILKSIEILRPLSEQDLCELAKNAHKLSFSHDEEIIVQDEEGSSMFIIAEGIAEVLIKTLDQDHPQVVDLIPHGRCFGERALLLGERRSATIRAKSHMVVYELEKKHLEPILRHTPALIEELSKIIATHDEQRSNVEKDSNLRHKEHEKEMKNLVTHMKAFFKIDES